MRISFSSAVTFLVGCAIGACITVSLVGLPGPSSLSAEKDARQAEPVIIEKPCNCPQCPRIEPPSCPPCAECQCPPAPPPQTCPVCPSVPQARTCPQCPTCEGKAELETVSKTLPTVFLKMKDMIMEHTKVEPLPHCTDSDRLAIVLPFRDREEHLGVFREWMRVYLRTQGICFQGFYVIEQDDDDLFDRGWLINIGYHLAKKDGATYFVQHDVDALPMPGVPYTKPVMPLQLSAEQDRFKFGVIYANYGGGVFSFANEQFEKINGCSNDYHGWGAEDDDLYWRLRRNGFTTATGQPHRPPHGQGVYVSLESHGHTARKFTPGSIRTARKWQAEMSQGSERWKKDGLNNLLYTITSGPTRDGDTVRVKVQRDPTDEHIGKKLAEAEDARLAAEKNA